jgi:peptidoglycan hydrolase CwlO-like protein
MNLLLQLQKNNLMGLTILYIVLAFAVGFGIAWVIVMNKLTNERKQFKSASGFLESERLIKETLQKELAVVHQQKMTIELELTQKLTHAQKIIRQMDADILLMQKSYEETEAQLLQTHPELHALKVELIEAKNNIARLKGLLAEK